MFLICNCFMVSFFMFAMDVSFWVGFDQEWGEMTCFRCVSNRVTAFISLVLVEGHCDLLIVKDRILMAL